MEESELIPTLESLSIVHSTTDPDMTISQRSRSNVGRPVIETCNKELSCRDVSRHRAYIVPIKGLGRREYRDRWVRQVGSAEAPA
jgi:hypothetical protein